MGARIFGVDVSAAATATQKFGLGDHTEIDSGVYVYAQADGAVDAGAACRIVQESAKDCQAKEIDTTLSGSIPTAVGIAQVALADNYYGWFWRGRGYTEALVATGVSANAALTTTATAGELGAGGDAVATLRCVDANSSGSTALGTVAAYGLLGTN